MLRAILGLTRSWAAYALSPMIGIVTAPLLARALGPDGRGQLAAVLQPLTVADALIMLGVPAAITFYVARGVPHRSLYRVASVLLGVSIVVVLGGLWFYAYPIGEATGLGHSTVMIVWSSCIVGVVLAARRAIFQGRRIFPILDMERTVGAVLRAAGVVLLFVAGASAVLGFVAVYILSGLVASLILLRPIPQIEAAADVPAPLEFSKYAVLASIGSSAAMLNNRLDQAILPIAISLPQLGIYAVAVTVAEVPVIVSTVTNRNLFAEVSSNSPLRNVWRTFLLGQAAITVVCGTLAILIPVLIPLVFTDDFQEAVPVCTILLLATAIAAISSASSAVLAGRGHPGLSSVGPGVGALLTVILLALLWGAMSPVAAAYVSLASQAASSTVGAALIYVSRGKEKVRV